MTPCLQPDGQGGRRGEEAEMSVRFVLGPAGAGKTHLCVRELAAACDAEPLGPPLLFLLPQQATFIHEQRLATACRGGGFCRAEINSFTRLAYRAYREAGMQPLPLLTEAGKLMLMRGCARRHDASLRIFAALSHRAGFAADMVAAAEELQIYGISPDRLEEVAAELADMPDTAHFAARLQEIALLYRAYSEAAADRYSGYAARMEFLAQRIEAGLLADTQVYIDGYSEFTPMERRVLAAMMQHCPRLTICLSLDPVQAERTVREEDVFYPGWHTYAQLRDDARHIGATLEEPVLLKRGRGRFARQPELALLECALAGQSFCPSEEQPEMIREWQARDRRAELSAVGREIRRLVREEGLRYREISVLLRDTQPYLHLLPAVFGAMEIPYFIDSKKPLLYHPLIELVRAVLEIWAYQPHYRHIMRLLKNVLSPIAGSEADILDNYCLAHGVRFYHWQQEIWSFPPVDGEDNALLAQVEEIRRRGAEPLFACINHLGEAASAKELNAALRDLLAAYDVAEQLQKMAAQARQAGAGEEAMQHAQAWEKLLDFFNEAESLLGDTPYQAAELADLYDAAFAGLTLSTIPAGLDQVFIASLERSRNPEIRAAFVLGMNEGAMPRRIVMDGLFRDHERRLLAEHGVQLAPDTLLRQFRENYFSYVALTRSSERLYLCYPLQDESGTVLMPSPLLRRIHEVFPGLQAVFCERPDARHLVGGAVDLALAATGLREEGGDPLSQALWQYYQAEPSYAPACRRAWQGLNFSVDNRPLSAASLRRLYGSTLRGSVSRLEKFRLCPFSYFAAYGLRLSRRRIYELTPADRGELFHHVLAAVGEAVRARDIAWAAVDEALAGELVDASLAEYLPLFLSGIMRSTARYAYLQGRIREALVSAVLLTARTLAGGEFQPVAFELAFGSDTPHALPALELRLDDGRRLQLSGRIDRVDMAESADGTRAYFRIVDYKTGDVSLDREDIAAGLRLQLLVYLQVVLTNSAVFTAKQPAVAGVYYAPVHDSLHTVNDASAAEAAQSTDKLSGLTVADREAVLLADRDIHGMSRLIAVGYHPDKDSFYSRPAPLAAEELTGMLDSLTGLLKETAAAMLDGLIRVSPLAEGDRDACAFCDFSAVCGFEREMAPCRSRKDMLTDGNMAGEEEQA